MNNEGDIFNAVFQRLSGDTVLSSSNHLGATGRVYRSKRPPHDANRALVLNFIGDAFINQQKAMANFLLRAIFFAPNFSNFIADETSADAVKKRVDVLLDGVSFSGSGVDRIISRKGFPHASARFDPAAPEEHFWVLQYDITAG